MDPHRYRSDNPDILSHRRRPGVHRRPGGSVAAMVVAVVTVATAGLVAVYLPAPLPRPALAVVPPAAPIILDFGPPEPGAPPDTDTGADDASAPDVDVPTPPARAPLITRPVVAPPPAPGAPAGAVPADPPSAPAATPSPGCPLPPGRPMAVPPPALWVTPPGRVPVPGPLGTCLVHVGDPGD